MTKTLDGKVALVTGASRGIGAAIAKRPARDHGQQRPARPVDTDMNPADGKFAALVKGSIAIGRYGKTDERGASA